MKPSCFKGIGQAKVGQGGVYFLPGRYKVEVAKVGMVESRNREDFFCVEATVQESDNPERRPGTKASWLVKMTQDAALGNIKGFLAAVGGVDPTNESALQSFFAPDPKRPGADPVEEAAEYAVSDENPCAGVVLGLQCTNKKTKKNTDFTLHFWSPVAA